MFLVWILSPIADLLILAHWVGAEMGNRRPLRDINNLVGAPPHPSAIAKKPMLE